jgi:hypothetical protein
MEEMNEEKKIEMNGKNMYQITEFTDLETGGIKKYKPVDAQGKADKTREVFFVAHTNIQTSDGVIPIQVTINDAKTLKSAIEKFGSNIDELLDEMLKAQQEKMAAMEEQMKQAEQAVENTTEDESESKIIQLDSI